jgi:hypothetical protein
MFEAKVSREFLSQKYSIRDTLTDNNYTLQVFYQSMFFNQDERIEIYDDQGQLFLKFNFGSNYIYHIFSKIHVDEDDKSISLTNTTKKNLVYNTHEDGEIAGYYEQFLPIPNDLTYKFVSAEQIKNPFYLVMSCLCHTLILRPHQA